MLIVLLACLTDPLALATDTEHPLKPLDRSSPQAALRTFLDAVDAVAEFMVGEYIPAPSREKHERLNELLSDALRSLDLSHLPAALHAKTGHQAMANLYAALNRIPLPPLDDAIAAPSPHADERNESDAAPEQWVLPNTEIALVRMTDGPQAGQYLFSADTVTRSGEFFARVRDLPYLRAVPYENLHEWRATWGGWMIPPALVESLPEPLRAPILDQAAWKWLAVVATLAAATLALGAAVRVSHLFSRCRPFLRALSGLIVPLSLLALTPALGYLLQRQVRLINEVAAGAKMAEVALFFIAAAWLAWRTMPVFAEAIIASPRVSDQSVSAHLIRTCARLLGIVVGAGLLATGASRLGIPVYGIVAGLGVGGLAIALAAQPAIENLIGGFSLFADKPVRVGNFGKYGDIMGTVEAIGIRSTRIRGVDRTVTTIPNAALSRMPIVNLDQRDRMLIQTTIGVRYETEPARLRRLLHVLREEIAADDRIDQESSRVRFIGFGPSSLDLEVFAYVLTERWVDFLAIREDVLLRLMERIEECGAAIAFPSQTIYVARDRLPTPVPRGAA